MKKSSTRALNQLAALYGIDRSYVDVQQQKRIASPDTLLAVLRAIGAPVDDFAGAEDALAQVTAERSAKGIEPVVVAWGGRITGLPVRLRGKAARRKCAITLRLEDGSQHTESMKPEALARAGRAPDAPTHRLTLNRTLPIGYHDIEIETADCVLASRVIAPPRQAFTRSSPDWGLFIPIYALRGSHDEGIGTFSDLAELARWTAARGGSFIGTLPLLPSFLDVCFEPSPYSPVSRLFWNELFIDTSRLEGAAIPAYAHHSERFVDYRTVGAHKLGQLRDAAAHFFTKGDVDALDRFTDAHPQLIDYARFRAVLDRRRESWHAWPDRMRQGTIEDGDFAPEDERYHRFVQWIAEEQLGAIATAAERDAAGLYLDLPLGVNPDGYDAWRQQSLFANGASTGAPPDALFTAGQNWGFRPPIPEVQRATGHQYFIDSLRHHMRHARMLRLDHVMALYRLYWVPNGADARDGAYVRYPVDELFAILAMESNRHGTAVVGEDLGTVPREIRTQMDRRKVQRMYVVQYELSPDDNTISAVPEGVVASVNTHDMPTFRGFVTGTELRDQLDLGLVDEDRYHQDASARHHLVQRLAARFGHAKSTRELLERILVYLAGSDAESVLVSLEDLWLESQPQNVPGTSSERPNWTRRARLSLAELMNDADVLEALELVDRRRSARARTAVTKG